MGLRFQIQHVCVLVKWAHVFNNSCCWGCEDGILVEKGSKKAQLLGMLGGKWDNTKLGVGEVAIEKIKNGLTKFNIMIDEKFLSFQVIKFTTFFTSEVSNKDAMCGIRVKIMSRMNKSCIT